VVQVEVAVAWRQQSLPSGKPLLHLLFSFQPGFEGLWIEAALEGRWTAVGSAEEGTRVAGCAGLIAAQGELANLHQRHWKNCHPGRRQSSIHACGALSGRVLSEGESEEAPMGPCLIWLASWIREKLEQEQEQVG
jgi:hypothetical protein